MISLIFIFIIIITLLSILFFNYNSKQKIISTKVNNQEDFFKIITFNDKFYIKPLNNNFLTYNLIDDEFIITYQPITSFRQISNKLVILINKDNNRSLLKYVGLNDDLTLSILPQIKKIEIIFIKYKDNIVYIYLHGLYLNNKSFKFTEFTNNNSHLFEIIESK